MKSLVFERFLLLAFCAAALVFAAIVLVEDIAEAQKSGRDPAATYLRAREVAPEFSNPYGWRSQEAQLTECEDLLTSVSARLSFPAARQRVAQSCLELAEGILTGAPTSGLAYLVKAEAAIGLGEEGNALEFLLLSNQLAASEGWLAARRLRFAVPRWGGDAATIESGDAATSPVIMALERDLLLLLPSKRYRPVLVQLYMQREEQRPWILATLDRAPTKHKRQFLRDVKQRLAVAGS